MACFWLGRRLSNLLKGVRAFDGLWERFVERKFRRDLGFNAGISIIAWYPRTNYTAEIHIRAPVPSRRAGSGSRKKLSGADIRTRACGRFWSARCR